MSSYDEWKLASPDRKTFSGTVEVVFPIECFEVRASVNGELDEIELLEIYFRDGNDIGPGSLGWKHLESFLWVRFRERIVETAWTLAKEAMQESYDG